MTTKTTTTTTTTTTTNDTDDSTEQKPAAVIAATMTAAAAAAASPASIIETTTTATISPSASTTNNKKTAKKIVAAKTTKAKAKTVTKKASTATTTTKKKKKKSVTTKKAATTVTKIKKKKMTSGGNKKSRRVPKRLPTTSIIGTAHKTKNVAADVVDNDTSASATMNTAAKGPQNNDQNGKDINKTTTKEKKAAPKQQQQQQQQKVVVQNVIKWNQLPGTVNVCDPFSMTPSSTAVGRSSPLPAAVVVLDEDEVDETKVERRAAKRRRVEGEEDERTTITTTNAITEPHTKLPHQSQATTKNNSTIDTNNNNDSDSGDCHYPQHLPRVFRDLPTPKKPYQSRTYFPPGTRREVKQTIVKAYDLHQSSEILEEFLHYFIEHRHQKSSSSSSFEFATRTIETVIEAQQEQRDAILNFESEKLTITEQFLQALVRHKIKYKGDMDIQPHCHNGEYLVHHTRKLRLLHAEVHKNKKKKQKNNIRIEDNSDDDDDDGDEEEMEKEGEDTKTTAKSSAVRKYKGGKQHDRLLQVFSKEDEPILTKFGFLWKNPRYPEHHKWEKMFELLKEYKDRHGDCKVPQLYRVYKKKDNNNDNSDNENDNNNNADDSIGLGLWVAKQRRQFESLQCGQKSQMTPERIEQLESIGFVWKLRFGRPKKGDERFRNKRLGILGTRNSSQQEDQAAAVAAAVETDHNRKHPPNAVPAAGIGQTPSRQQPQQQQLFDDDYYNENENYRWYRNSSRMPFL